jgi:hypothetical protein
MKRPGPRPEWKTSVASLLEVQARFAAAMRGERGLAEADVVDGGIEAAARLAIYRNNARAMFDGALERTYPVLRRRVGEDYFRQLTRGYRERFPSRSGDLHWIGEHFARYLAATEAGSGYEWLAELAELEWACECALICAREQPVEPQVLVRLAPDDLARARLRLQPSLHCVASNYPVLEVWRANQPEADGHAVDLERGGQCVLVSCGPDGLELAEAPAAALEFTRLLKAGTPLGAAVEGSGLDLAELPGVLARLFSSGLVTEVSVPAAEHDPP